MPKILFVDDDIFPPVKPSDEVCVRARGDYMWYYQEAIREQRGYNVYAVSNVDAVIGEITARMPDLVVLDIMMGPGHLLSKLDDVRGGLCTGIELAKIIHSDFPKIPIVLLSNAVAPEAPQRDFARNLWNKDVVQEVFYKPKTTPFRFRDAIRDLLEEE